MKILGDRQILLFNELFSSLGETTTYTGRSLTAEQLDGVDVLVTRSTLKVDESLLADTSVCFAGTCTIGVDHYDTAFLDQQNIAWSNAAGCNAQAVVQYALSAMAQLAPHWLTATVGIVGCGNIGGQVYRALRALGVNCRVYDPLISADQCPHLTRLEEVLQADIITCHAPLTCTGSHPSHHLISTSELQQLRPNSVLISAGRGAVVDNPALLSFLSEPSCSIKVALDVWENEPDILAELIPLVDIATPHIAGHSVEGKEKGTVMIYNAVCDFLRSHPTLSACVESAVDASQKVNTETSVLSLEAFVGDDQAILNQYLLKVYPIMDDDARLRQWHLSNTPLAEYFDHLRRDYPIRREYSHFILSPASQAHKSYDFVNRCIQSVLSC